MESKKPDNVIQLPTRKKEVSSSQKETLFDQQEISDQGLRPSRRSRSKRLGAWTALSLASVMALSYVGNRLAPNSEMRSTEMASHAPAARGVASIGDRLEWHRDIRWERALAKRLNKTEAREIASVKAKGNPSAEDRLRFEEFRNYTVQMDSQGRIAEISIVQGQTGNIPHFNHKEFFAKYGGLLPEGFARHEQETRRPASNSISESYGLLDSADQKVGAALVELDSAGRLLSMKVQSLK